jgi:E3 ubiquitin-protein ligase TRIP12
MTDDTVPKGERVPGQVDPKTSRRRVTVVSFSFPADWRTANGVASRTLIDDSMGEAWPGEGSGSGALGEGTDDDFDEMGMNEDDEDDEDPLDEELDEDAAEQARSNPFRSGMNIGGPGGMASRLAQLASESGMHLDEATAAAIFGTNFRSFGGMSSGLAGRFKRLRSELTSSNPSTRHSALRECSELLLVSNEDTLGGAFSVTSFATEFIAILDGRPNINPDAPTEVVRPPDEMDEDAQLAAALAMSAGEDMPSGGGNENEMETQLIACRCLAHLMEALPGSGHTLVQLGAVPVLCSKLNEISYIELAEQTLSVSQEILPELTNRLWRRSQASTHLLLSRKAVSELYSTTSISFPPTSSGLLSMQLPTAVETFRATAIKRSKTSSPPFARLLLQPTSD